MNRSRIKPRSSLIQTLVAGSHGRHFVGQEVLILASATEKRRQALLVSLHSATSRESKLRFLNLLVLAELNKPIGSIVRGEGLEVLV